MPRSQQAQKIFERADELAEEASRYFEGENEQRGDQVTRKALAKFEEALELAPDDGEILFSIGTQHYNLGDKTSALAFYHQALNQLDREISKDLWMKCLCYRAGSLFQLGKLKEATQDVETALELDADHPLALQIRTACESVIIQN